MWEHLLDPKVIGISLLLVIIVLVGILLLVTGLLRLFRLKLIGGLARISVGAVLTVVAALGVGVSLNLLTYHRLIEEQPVAIIRFESIGRDDFGAAVTFPDGHSRKLGISGDEWQMDVRVLKWSSAATDLGLDSLYRLDRISGRYLDIEMERNEIRSVHDLSASRGLNTWQYANKYRKYLPFVDAMYGSAAYLPMADGAMFEVTLSESGLVARPMNSVAEEAVDSWQ